MTRPEQLLLVVAVPVEVVVAAAVAWKDRGSTFRIGYTPKQKQGLLLGGRRQSSTPRCHENVTIVELFGRERPVIGNWMWAIRGWRQYFNELDFPEDQSNELQSVVRF